MLHLGIGDTLLIQCAHFEERYLGVLVGQEEGRLLVVYADLPHAVLKGLRKNPCVTVRYAHESTLHGFDTHLLERPNHSGELLFLAYPQSTEKCDQRCERRLLCNFPSHVLGHGYDLPCLVHDISASAVRVSFEKIPESPPAFLFKPNEELQLEFFVIQPTNNFSFRCRLLREFIASGRRHAVLLLHESETTASDMLRDYVECVFAGPVKPNCR